MQQCRPFPFYGETGAEVSAAVGSAGAQADDAEAEGDEEDVSTWQRE